MKKKQFYNMKLSKRNERKEKEKKWKGEEEDKRKKKILRRLKIEDRGKGEKILQARAYLK